ncbi:hypothetical protein ACFWSF_09840 [Streptomyces sp. NPDC058611]|uniref:hypothetical protein n=1 Tax=unclassified Streptomyces TaxID=2593676 RepID=UPI00365CE050
MTSDDTVPPLWFRLPPGFHDISPSDRSALEAVADALESPAAQRDIAQLTKGLVSLHAHDVAYTSIGLHPDDPAGMATSVFSLTVRPAQHPNPRVSVAQTALTIARCTLWRDPMRRLIDLPSGLPCCLVAGLISPDGVGDHLFQARVTTTDPEGQHILILDLTSAAVGYADAYTSILEAVAHTLSFTDPNPRPAESMRTSRLLEVLL